MEIDSDSSSGTVFITGPIPEYPELQKRKTRNSVPARNGHPNKRKEYLVDLTLDDKVGKIREVEIPVKATAEQGRSRDKKDDEDAWSGSDTKSVKGCGKRDPASKYLKKIKTLQQNKRRQETRISRLTKEVRSLRDKVSIQAAYIDVLCGMLGDDMKEKFRGRQGMGILGNNKMDDDQLDSMVPVERGENGSWAQEDGANDKTGSDVALKEKEKEFFCVEDLDDLDENDGMSPAESCEDLKEAMDAKGETMESDSMAPPLAIAGPSTSFAVQGNKKTGQEVIMNALTIAVGQQGPGHMLRDGGQTTSSPGQAEIHHGGFAAPFERRLCEFEGQVGESVFAQVPKVSTRELYGEMRVPVSYVKPYREPMPPVISYGIVMGNQGLNLLPAVHRTVDDPLNIGSDDTSSYGPLIISTSLDPLNLISHPPAMDRMQIKATSSTDPLNIGSDGGLGDPTDLLPDHSDPIDQSQSRALFIQLPSSTDEPAGSNHSADVHHQSKKTEPTPNPEATHSTSAASGNGQAETIPTHSSNHPSSTYERRAALSMPELSDISGDHVDQQDYDCGNISHPQEIVDHLINNMSCDLSPGLRLE